MIGILTFQFYPIFINLIYHNFGFRIETRHKVIEKS